MDTPEQSTTAPSTATTFTGNTRSDRLNVFRSLLEKIPKKPSHIFDPIKQQLARYRQMNESKITEVISQLEIERADRKALEEELAEKTLVGANAAKLIS